MNAHNYVNVSCPTKEHLDFIRTFGEHRICQSSFDLYKSCSGQLECLYECRTKKEGILIGICFASIIQDTTHHNITVVHKDYRRQGIGTTLLSLRTIHLQGAGINTNSRVSITNTPSTRLCNKVLQPIHIDSENCNIQWFKDKRF